MAVMFGKGTGVVFDMDDTLYKEYHYRHSGFACVADHYAAACGMTPADLLAELDNSPSVAFEFIEEKAAAKGVKVTIAEILTVYRSHRPDISLDANAVFALTRLSRSGHLLGVITDGRALGQINKIAALDLERYIAPEMIMPTVLYDTDKHHPEPFVRLERLMRQLGATSMAYVGDNPSKDFMFPNMMGWRTVMLADFDNVNIHRQDLAEWPPQYRPQTIITSLRQLI